VTNRPVVDDGDVADSRDCSNINGRQLVRRLGDWNSALLAGAAYVIVITAGS